MPLRWCFAFYLPIAVLLSAVGSYFIGMGTNELQWAYRRWKLGDDYFESRLEVYYDEFGQAHVGSVISPNDKLDSDPVWFIISNGQMLLIPLWTILCVGAAGSAFYRFEMKEAIDALREVPVKISENDLDFSLSCRRKNELWELCIAFEKMRERLYENNRAMWRSLEERKRLSSAFSHDLRTPLTVLRGYGEFLEKHLGSGKISPEKQQEIVQRMMGQIERLESYTVKMSSISKLEDIAVQQCPADTAAVFEELREIGRVICGDKKFNISFEGEKLCEVYIDREIISEVYENLLSNGVRFAKNRVSVTVKISGSRLFLTVCDDGQGFSPEELSKVQEPFYRGKAEGGVTGGEAARDSVSRHIHFGLGLYICRVLCGKCGGELLVENGGIGGAVTAVFDISEKR